MSASATVPSLHLTRGRLLARNTLWNLLGSGAPALVALLAQEIVSTANARMPWVTPNGSRFQGLTHRVWTRLRNRNTAEDA